MTCPLCGAPTDQHGALTCDVCNPEPEPPCFLSPDAIEGWTWAAPELDPNFFLDAVRGEG